MSNDKYNTGPDDIVTRIAALEARVSMLERVPSLQNASIDKGGLTVKEGLIRVVDNTGTIRAAFGKQIDGDYDIRVFDPTGDTRVKMGLLDSGDYGFNVKENGQNIFHEVPFVYSDFIQTGETATSTTYQDLATVGPQVTVAVGSSGRILMFATAQMQYISSTGANITQGGVFNVAMSGANSRTPSDSVDPLVGLWTQNMIVSTGTDTFTNIITITAQATFTGLTPGNTTITMKYRRSSTAASNTDFFRRGLAVIRL